MKSLFNIYLQTFLKLSSILLKYMRAVVSFKLLNTFIDLKMRLFIEITLKIQEKLIHRIEGDRYIKNDHEGSSEGCPFHAIQREARQEWPFHVFQAIQEHAQASFLVCTSFIVPKHARLHRLLPRFLDSLQHNPTCNLRHGLGGNCYALWVASL